MKRKTETWASEAAMFDDFIAKMKSQGWTAYPETCGHDLVLEGHGLQVVVEGKLRTNLDVLSQALPPWMCERFAYYDFDAPGMVMEPGTRAADYYTILTPGKADVRAVAAICMVACIAWPKPIPEPERWRSREMPTPFNLLEFLEPWPTGPRLAPLALGLAVEQQAGLPSPRRVSPWKIDAVKLALRLRGGAELRSKDFAGTAVSAPTFVQRGWMRPVRKEGRLTVYAIGPRADHAPDLLYPEIVAALAAKAVAA